MSDEFYRAFEDRHRGSRELIKSRLRVYLPFIEPLKAYYPDAPTVDLGCGRGEWLELLQENGFSPVGFDVDDGMLEACQGLGLSTEHNDAVKALQLLANESQIVVSGFHIAEHLPFDMLRTLVKEALRVLKPGGLLILETPNPENLTVGASSFYLDPTHLRPIPSPLLAFLPEYYGFKNVKTIRLQESANLKLDPNLTLEDVLSGVSPDYAVIAQKDAYESILFETRPAFEKEYGVSLGMLAARYDYKIQQVEEKAQQAQLALNAIYASSSWRMTAPLRWAIVAIRRGLVRAGAAPSSVKPLIRQFLAPVIRYVLARPALAKVALVVINRLPALKQRMKRYHQSAQTAPIEIAHLTPRARYIYTSLKAAMNNKKEPS